MSRLRMLRTKTKDFTRIRAHTRTVETSDGFTRIKHAGAGTPTVVFLGGIGEGLKVWDTVLTKVAKVTHAISYDRLGLGRSSPTTAPRDSTHIAAELYRLLDALKEHEPVRVVAHSAGAFHARMFAHLYRERIGGLIFVEPSHEDWLLHLKDADPKAWLKHMEWRKSARHSSGHQRELAAWETIVGEMRSLGPALPNLPDADQRAQRARRRH